MRLGTFTADIVVGGKALEQYDVVSESPTKMTCWIASEEGKSFSVKWTCHEEHRTKGVCGIVSVDGTSCGCAFLLCEELATKNTVVFSRFINRRTERELKFAQVQLSDDDSLLDKGIPKNLGEICLVIKRGAVAKVPRDIGERDVPVFNDNKFHERAKKATIHCIGFGPENPRLLTRYQHNLIPNGDPELTFVFKYQPLSILQANGIVPRPTSNDAITGREAGSGERDASDAPSDTPEDIKPAQLNERIQSLENELKRLRDMQGGNSEEQKPKRIKKEEPRRPLFNPGEIIDLT